jgi:hypothetical protein
MRLLKLNDLIRVGRNYDGGYVIADSLMQESTALLSFGINDDWSFEEDFCRRSGVGCYGFDFSVNRGLFLKRSLEQIRFFFGDVVKRRTLQWGRWKKAGEHFHLYNEFGRFFGKNSFYSIGVDKSTHGVFKTLDDVLKDHVRQQKNIFLKVDIEGYEYKILDDILRNKQQFHALAVEIHGIHEPANDFGAFMRGLEQEFYVYHIHANNYSGLRKRDGMPDVIEVSCIRKDLVQNPVFHRDLSHLPLAGIDFPNDLTSADFTW